MAVAKINVNTDEETKMQAQKLLHEMGLDMTTAINIYLKRIILEKGIPFEISTKLPNAETLAALKETEAMLKNPGEYKRYNSFSEVLAEVL